MTTQSKRFPQIQTLHFHECLLDPNSKSFTEHQVYSRCVLISDLSGVKEGGPRTPNKDNIALRLQRDEFQNAPILETQKIFSNF